MGKGRNIEFLNDGYYHIFNRGVDKRSTFKNSRNFQRALELLYFYQFTNTPLRFSHYLRANDNIKKNIDSQMIAGGKKVHITAYCLMPNHFHLLIKQKREKGIPQFLSEFENAYTRYFNLAVSRSGVLFQSTFKAVFVESNEQLLHLTRYIHLNPTTASIVNVDQLNKYPWSSYNAYISNFNDNVINKEDVHEIVAQITNYKTFVHDNASYAKELKQIQHITLED